jgi:hypothetical protein
MRKQKSHSRVVTTFALALVLLASWLALPAKYQHLLEPTALATAKTFTVNSTGDGGDVNFGDGICDADPGPATVCTLRGAIGQANANSGTDTINFNSTSTLTQVAAGQMVKAFFSSGEYRSRFGAN